MTTALIFALIFAFCAFIFTLLAFKSNNFVVRTVAILMFFTTAIASVTYGPAILGDPQERVFLDILYPDVNKVEVISYAFDQNDQKTVHFWLREEGSNRIFYYIERDFTPPKKSELSEEGQKAEEQGKKLYMYLQGKPSEVEENGDEGIGEESKYDFEAEPDPPGAPDPMKKAPEQPMLFRR